MFEIASSDRAAEVSTGFAGVTAGAGAGAGASAGAGAGTGAGAAVGVTVLTGLAKGAGMCGRAMGWPKEGAAVVEAVLLLPRVGRDRTGSAGRPENAGNGGRLELTEG